MTSRASPKHGLSCAWLNTGMRCPLQRPPLAFHQRASFTVTPPGLGSQRARTRGELRTAMRRSLAPEPPRRLPGRVPGRVPGRDEPRSGSPVAGRGENCGVANSSRHAPPQKPPPSRVAGRLLPPRGLEEGVEADAGRSWRTGVPAA